MTAVRQSIKTVEASPIPVGLTQNVFMVPFSAPGTVESMKRPVYPPGVRFDSGGCLGRAVKPVILFLRGGSAARVGPAQRQRAYRSASSAQLTGGTVEFPGYVDWSEDRLCEPRCQRSTAFSVVRVYVQDYLGAGFSHSGTKIKVDAEHSARMSRPPWALVVILGKCPEKSRSNAPSLAATISGR